MATMKILNAKAPKGPKRNTGPFYQRISDESAFAQYTAEPPKFLQENNGNKGSHINHFDTPLQKFECSQFQAPQEAPKPTHIEVWKVNDDPVEPQTPAEKPVSEEPQKLNFQSEPPLLEDLGIDPTQIKRKLLSIAKMEKVNKEMVDDADLAGPIMVAITLGTLLLFRGKVQFGYIYGYGFTGCLAIF